MSDDERRNIVVNRPKQTNDTFTKKSRIDVESSLPATRLFNDHRDDGVVDVVGYVSSRLSLRLLLLLTLLLCCCSENVVCSFYAGQPVEDHFATVLLLNDKS